MDTADTKIVVDDFPTPLPLQVKVGLDRGWHGYLLTVGRLERGYVWWAGMNFTKLPDFCGGSFVGDVNCGSASVSDDYKDAPIIPELPTHRYGFSRSYSNGAVWALMSLWHGALTFCSGYGGSRIVSLYDRITGPTYQSARHAIPALTGRDLWNRKANEHNPGYQTIAQVIATPHFLNYNSGNDCVGMQIIVDRGDRKSSLVSTQEYIGCRYMEEHLHIPGLGRQSRAFFPT